MLAILGRAHVVYGATVHETAALFSRRGLIRSLIRAKSWAIGPSTVRTRGPYKARYRYPFKRFAVVIFGSHLISSLKASIGLRLYIRSLYGELV